MLDCGSLLIEKSTLNGMQKMQEWSASQTCAMQQCSKIFMSSVKHIRLALLEHSLGHHICPQSRLRGPIPEHLVRDGGQMMDQPKIGSGQSVPLRLRIHSKIRERKLASLPPEINCGLDLRRPKQIGLLRRLRRFRHHGSRTVHVVAPNLMLSAVLTTGRQYAGHSWENVGSYHCGNVSSQRICRRLHVLHPLRDLVWLRLEGPPPGPAIASGNVSEK